MAALLVVVMDVKVIVVVVAELAAVNLALNIVEILVILLVEMFVQVIALTTVKEPQKQQRLAPAVLDTEIYVGKVVI